ncbi:trypsin delta-like [Haematobia irritans]|uniref:Putative trypsin delta/gamma-like protein n=1 Tax=Haematobia irritans TaxID=7368 RepID=A0A1L8EGH2_HAEIR
MYTVKIGKYLLFCLLWSLQCAASENDTTEIYPDIESTPLPLLYPQGRIVNGNSASDGQFPYQVSLRYNGYHTCGGSIISANYVVTAAHCVKSLSPSRLTIRAGSRLVNSNGQIVGISKVTTNPSFRGTGNDIALLKLSSPLKLNDKVKAIPLARKDPPSGAAVVVSGWGRLGRCSRRTPKVLQYTTFTALTKEQCRRRLFWVSPTVLCLAHPFGKGACNGDSGGPAVYKNELVGVANYVVGGCASDLPDGYASVAYHYNWLKKNSDL